MLPRKLWRRLRSLLTPKRKRRIPVYGRADAQWFTAISLSLEADELPSVPSSLAVCVTLAHGYAGVGWYDVDGQLRVRVAGGQATVRDSAGKKELVVRAEFNGKEAKLTQEYDW